MAQLCIRSTAYAELYSVGLELEGDVDPHPGKVSAPSSMVATIPTP
jgi:hypothetical protein